MPRGADDAGDPPQSDNAVTLEHDIAHGADGKPTTEVNVDKSHKVAPLPEGLKEEVNDRVLSGGGSSGPTVDGSGKGGNEPRKTGVDG